MFFVPFGTRSQTYTNFQQLTVSDRLLELLKSFQSGNNRAEYVGTNATDVSIDYLAVGLLDLLLCAGFCKEFGEFAF